MVTSNAAVSSKSYDQLCILRKSHVNLIDALAPQADKRVRRCSAVLIDYKRHWQEWKVEVHRTPWIYQKLKNIHKDLMGLFSLHVIRASIELLIELGLLERRSNPGNGQDKTYQYNLRWDKIQAAIANQGKSVEVKGKVKNSSLPRKFRSESSEFTVERHQQLQSKAIAPYATFTESPLVQKALLPEAPEGAENAEAYRLYKPSEKEVAPPPPGYFQEAMAKLMGKLLLW
jgi:hypothetical protein